MANLPLLAARLFNHPHLVLPAYAETVVAALAHRMGVNSKLDGGGDIPKRPARDKMMTKDGILILPVVGGLYHRGDSLDAMSGAESYTNLTNQIVSALDDKEVKGILLDIDSPGGEATGCFEFADTVLDARKKKPIWAIANGSAFSAAYAIASSASKLYVTPSGGVGSIGVVYIHRDVSKMLEMAGIDVTMIYAGSHKVDGNPYEPLPPDVRDGIQSSVDGRYQDFIKLVAARRPMSLKQIRDTQADVFDASRSVELGLADEVASFSKVLAAFRDELNPTYVVTNNGVERRMSTDNPAPVASGARIEGLDAALARAREDGMAAARAEASTQIVEAYQKGRTDAAAILGHEAAEGRIEAAVNFAKNSKFSVEEAVTFMSAMPADNGKSFQARLKANDPKVPATAEKNEDANPINDFQQSVSGHVRALLGHKQ